MRILSSPEFKVGAFVLIVAAIIGTMSMNVSDDPVRVGAARRYWFTLSDARGLVAKSQVKMAGIDVGTIESIQLKDGLARVSFLVRKDVAVTPSSRVEIRTSGILGDRYVEVVQGGVGEAPLEDGSEIRLVMDKGSMDSVISDVGNITKSLSEVAENLKMATSGEGDVKQPLGRIIKNIETLTGDLAAISSAKKEKINEIVDKIHSITVNIDEMLTNADGGFKQAFEGASRSLARIDRSLKNIEEITDKINSGRGTIGKLVNDETTVEELNTAISGVNSYLDSASRLETAIDFNSSYMTSASVAKTVVGLRIQPGLDRFYDVLITDDPLANSGGIGAAGPRSQTRFTLTYAKNFYDFTVRGGLIESFAGIGVDYNWLKRLRSGFEVFDLGQTHTRFYTRYNFKNGIYMVGGVDDVATRPERSITYVGAGVFLTNDDLKLLMSKVAF